MTKAEMIERATRQVVAVDRMRKKGFVVDYTARAVVYMSGVIAGFKRYVQVSVDGLVNGQPAMAYL